MDDLARVARHARARALPRAAGARLRALRAGVKHEEEEEDGRQKLRTARARMARAPHLHLRNVAWYALLRWFARLCNFYYLSTISSLLPPPFHALYACSASFSHLYIFLRITPSARGVRATPSFRTRARVLGLWARAGGNRRARAAHNVPTRRARLP